MEPQEEQRQHWSFDQRINVAHLLSTVALLITLIGVVVATDRRITLLEAGAAQQERRDAAQDSQVAAALLLLRNEIADMRGEVREAGRRLERYMERREEGKR